MRLTVEQRLAALERDNVILHDTIKLLHRLLKQQRELINDYITHKVTAASPGDGKSKGNVRPEEAVYTFRCRQRFDRMERTIEKIRKMLEDTRLGRMAG